MHHSRLSLLLASLSTKAAAKVVCRLSAQLQAPKRSSRGHALHDERRQLRRQAIHGDEPVHFAANCFYPFPPGWVRNHGLWPFVPLGLQRGRHVEAPHGEAQVPRPPAADRWQGRPSRHPLRPSSPRWRGEFLLRVAFLLLF